MNTIYNTFINLFKRFIMFIYLIKDFKIVYKCDIKKFLTLQKFSTSTAKY